MSSLSYLCASKVLLSQFTVCLPVCRFPCPHSTEAALVNVSRDNNASVRASSKTVMKYDGEVESALRKEC